jgi:hypothetical protein
MTRKSEIPLFEWPVMEKQFEAWDWNSKQRRLSEYEHERERD